MVGRASCSPGDETDKRSLIKRGTNKDTVYICNAGYIHCNVSVGLWLVYASSSHVNIEYSDYYVSC